MADEKDPASDALTIALEGNTAKFFSQELAAGARVGFVTADADLLATFAEQAPSSVENAPLYEEVRALNEELEDRVRRGAGVAPAGATRVMVSGCPSVLGNWKLHHLIESGGAVVVCDETCTGTRYFSAHVEERDGDLDAQIAAIAARYLTIDCSCFSPNDERIDSILRQDGTSLPNTDPPEGGFKIQDLTP